MIMDRFRIVLYIYWFLSYHFESFTKSLVLYLFSTFSSIVTSFYLVSTISLNIIKDFLFFPPIPSGVTRRSIIDLANAWNTNKNKESGKPQLEVSERWLTMQELVTASREGRVSVEVFM